MSHLRLIRSNGDSSHSPLSSNGLVEALRTITQQRGEAFGSRLLMEHETQALVVVLQGQHCDEVRLARMVVFLRQVDPLARDGWDETRLDAYIQGALESLDQPVWLTRSFDLLASAQCDVSKKTGMRLFRSTLLKAALAQFITQLPPDEVELTCATG
ncbi:hypothetical protein EPN81_01650 [Patescibacteria group bacterium]|nr:MAG: hypothetical protein EPN81_01650 [Patescibacteria group bacterium]